MTWVAGITSIGYALAFGDVRISKNTGKGRDVPVNGFGVRKLHQIAPTMIAGFSGNIERGFQLIEDMRDFVHDSQDVLPEPEDALSEWIRSRRWAEKTSLIVVGVSPTRFLEGPPDTGVRWPLAFGRVIRPSVRGLNGFLNIKRFAVYDDASLGSGSRPYGPALKRFVDIQDQRLMDMMIAERNDPGSVSAFLAQELQVALATRAELSVSEELTLCSISSTTVSWLGARPRGQAVEPIATTWEDTQVLLAGNDEGANPSALFASRSEGGSRP